MVSKNFDIFVMFDTWMVWWVCFCKGVQERSVEKIGGGVIDSEDVVMFA